MSSHTEKKKERCNSIESVHTLEKKKEKFNSINSVHTIASTAKRIIERLPETLLTTELYPKFVKIYENSSYANVESKHKQHIQPKKTQVIDEASKPINKEEEQKAAIPILQKLLLRLPPINYGLLKRIIQVCVLISNCEESHMSPNNLAVNIGATFKINNDIKHLKSLRSTVTPILETLIFNSGAFFDDEQVESFEEIKYSIEKELPCLEDDKTFLKNIIGMYNVKSLDRFSWPTISEQLKRIKNYPILQGMTDSVNTIENRIFPCCNII